MSQMQYIGQTINVDCGKLGVYQGLVLSVDTNASKITLSQAFKNGLPCDSSTVSILANQIKTLKFIEAPPLATSSICKKALRRESSDTDDSDCTPTRGVTSRSVALSTKTNSTESKPAKVIRAKTIATQHVKPEQQPKSQRHRSSSFSADDNSCSRHHPLSKRPERRANVAQQFGEKSDCFSVSVDSFVGDFDFEKNLALFDKQQIFSEIENGPSNRLTPKRPVEKFKHDEMIIKSSNSSIRQIELNDSVKSAGEYVTDEGLIVPCITYEARQMLFEKANEIGLVKSRISDLVGRNASDMVFQLIGGSSRLNPRNVHQKPTVVVLCGPHMQGVYGVSCARHLANHNINVVLFLNNFVKVLELLQQELDLFQLSHSKRISNTDELPHGPVDLIVNCLDTHDFAYLASQQWYKNVIQWCNNSKASMLAIDPPAHSCSSMDIKWLIHIALPTNLHLAAAQSYLCDVAIPSNIFEDIGVKYRSPFGSKFCIPLYQS